MSSVFTKIDRGNRQVDLRTANIHSLPFYQRRVREVSDRLGFLHQAIMDTQATTRALDVRIGFLLVILCLPVPIAEKLVDGIGRFPTYPVLVKGVIVGAIILWTLALYVSFLAVSAIDNPVDHIPDQKPEGTFYGGDLFQVSLLDAFKTTSKQSTRSVSSEILRIPAGEDEIAEELVFEKLKVTYIRDIKMKRFQVATQLSLACVVTSIIGVVLTHVAT